jgi:titin
MPLAPRLIKATPRNGSVIVTWAAPTNDGGESITDYLVEWTSDGVTWNSANAGNLLTYTIPGLVNGTGYKVRVSATNTVQFGYGRTAGTLKAVKPYLKLPTAPRLVKATAASSSLVVSWKAPLADGGSAITDYLVEWSTDGVNWSSASAGNGLTYTVTGLIPGTGYRVRVSATNTAQPGYGPRASALRPVKPLL